MALPHCIITIFLYFFLRLIEYSVVLSWLPFLCFLLVFQNHPLIIVICILQVVPSEAHYFLLQDEVSQLERNSDFVMCSLNSLWALRIEFGDVGLEIFFECTFKATVIFLLGEPSWEFGSPVTLDFFFLKHSFQNWINIFYLCTCNFYLTYF